MRAQTQMVFIFILVAIFIGVVVIFGYNAITKVTEAGEEVAVATLVSDIQSDIDSVRRTRGSSREFSYRMAGGADKVCFISDFSTAPPYLQAFVGGEENAFLMDGTTVVEAFSVGNIEVNPSVAGPSDGSWCINAPTILRFRVEGTGSSSVISQG